MHIVVILAVSIIMRKRNNRIKKVTTMPMIAPVDNPNTIHRNHFSLYLYLPVVLLMLIVGDIKGTLLEVKISTYMYSVNRYFMLFVHLLLIVVDLVGESISLEVTTNAKGCTIYTSIYNIYFLTYEVQQ